MAEHEPKGNAEEDKKPEIKKTSEYRRFKKLLKQVIKAPPLRNKNAQAKQKEI
jgi:hypothetical protein